MGEQLVAKNPEEKTIKGSCECLEVVGFEKFRMEGSVKNYKIIGRAIR